MRRTRAHSWRRGWDEGADIDLRTLLDWKVWVGIAIPVAAIAYTVHDVSLAEVAETIQGANVWPILAMVPAQILVVWVRAYRWSLLTRSLSDPPPTLTDHWRATLVGFFALNVLPFRIGELVRPWALSQRTKVPATQALGTVALERVIDFATLAVLGGLVLFFQARALPDWVQSGARVLGLLGAIPLGFLALLRWNRERALALVAFFARPLPDKVGDTIVQTVRDLIAGFESLRGWRATLRMTLMSFVIWFIALPVPFALGLLAFNVELPMGQFLLAVMTAHVFTALAVAAPAAPGFFGVYHFACREALALFGVSATTAVGYGTIVHLSYWLPITLLGGLAAAAAGVRLGDLRAPGVGQAAPEGR